MSRKWGAYAVVLPQGAPVEVPPVLKKTRKEERFSFPKKYLVRILALNKKRMKLIDMKPKKPL